MKNEYLDRAHELGRLFQQVAPYILDHFSPTPGADPRRAEMLGVTAKSSPRDLVTKVDKTVEETLTELLAKSFPGEILIGEESGKRPDPSLDCFWILDPIDGTTNFSRAYPFFCTTGAFVVADPQAEGGFRTVAAATLDPIRNELFIAARGQGAFLNRSRLKVAPTAEASQGLFVTGFVSTVVQRHGADLAQAQAQQAFEIFERITRQTLGVRRDGSAALDLAYVACGRVDAFWESGLAPWDVAAGSLLVEESGGKMSTVRGQKWGLFSKDLLASNQILHNWLLEQLVFRV